MKNANKQRLYADLAKYTKQIGILPNEIPKLVIDRKEMQQLLLTKRPRTGNPRVDKRVPAYGACVWSLRTIFVDINRRIQTHKIYKGFRYSKMELLSEYKHKVTYRDLLKTLVHELVHYRFSYMSHGAKFEQRVKEILEGRIFEPKHVHLFASYPKCFRQNIDGGERVASLKNVYVNTRKPSSKSS
jgi:hypothetical protein